MPFSLSPFPCLKVHFTEQYAPATLHGRYSEDEIYLHFLLLMVPHIDHMDNDGKLKKKVYPTFFR